MFLWFFGHHTPELVKALPFAISWSKRNRPKVLSSGLKVTPTKVVFRTVMPPPEKEFEVEFEIHARLLHAHVKADRPKLVSTAEGYQHELVCTFVGIPADDWDCIMRYLRDEDEANFEGSFFDPTKPDDEFRSLPTAIQNQIVADLVSKGRLNEPAADVAPLIRMRAQGMERAGRGVHIAKYLIRSRYVFPEDGGKADFDTRYTISDGHAQSIAEPKKVMYSANKSRR